VFYEKSHTEVRGPFRPAQQLSCIVLHSATIAHHTPIFFYPVSILPPKIIVLSQCCVLRRAIPHLLCVVALLVNTCDASHSRSELVCTKLATLDVASNACGAHIACWHSVNTSFLSSGPLCSATITRLQTLRKLYADTVEEMGTAAGTPPASTPKQPRKVRLQQAMHCKTMAALRRLEHGIMSEWARPNVRQLCSHC
jgi:hypothetical protein